MEIKPFRTAMFFAVFFAFSSVVKAQSEKHSIFAPSSDSFGTYAIQFHKGVKIPDNLHVKYEAHGWHYVLGEREELYRLIEVGIISRIYIEPIGHQTLNDSSRLTHFVNEVHQGQNMDFSFTGSGIIIGYVDTGLDYNHLDFKDSLGNTRVLRYWDQAAPVNVRTPTKYGYGQAFSNTDINGGINPSYANGSHGTTVTGCGSGNGMANGRNLGMAPECSIIIVRSNMSAPSWTLTVAEGVDYIFSVADSLGMPAVVNLSLGTYLGSHDATDPAAQYIDSLLNDQTGRIVVCAAGNSGAWMPYHVQKELSADTNFVWMIPNPALGYGSPGVFMDLWADTSDIELMHFAFGADKPGPVYRGGTSYKPVNFNIPTIQYDTIWGYNAVIGYVLYVEQVVGSNYNIQAIIYTDSLSYRFRFLATGSGNIDLWSSSQIGGSNFETNIPSLITHPEFIHYIMPDTEQSIVSSWACSEQVITVGNVQNRKNYISSNNTVFPVGGGTIPSGQLSINSSKGPTRNGLIKPDVVASGDMSLSARVLNVSYAATMLDIGAMHVRNGGTSMASPVVAGIAGLYLEKCPLSSWVDYKNSLLETAFSDGFTGPNLPNNAFGYGKAHAHNSLLQTEFTALVSGSEMYCPENSVLTVLGNDLISSVWNTDDSTFSLNLYEQGTYFAEVTNDRGCRNFTDTLVVLADTIAPFGLAPENLIVTCLDDVPVPNESLVTQIEDNCGSALALHLGDTLIGVLCEQYILRTYRILDLSGNFLDVNQQILISDTLVPYGLPPSNLVVSCADLLPEIDVFSVTNVSDNCSAVDVVHLLDFYSNQQCPQLITRKYRLFDACGNYSDADQIITILDTISPTGSIVDTLFVNCLAAAPAPDINQVENEADNCLLESVNHLGDEFDDENENVLYRTYEISDICSNTINLTQVIVITNNLPEPSLVSFDGSFLSASENLNYQWYFNGELMTGAIEQEFMPTNGGAFIVQVIDSNGCTSFSEQVFVSLVGMPEQVVSDLFVYPNPTDGLLYFHFEMPFVRVALYDLAGSLVLEKLIRRNSSLDLSALSSGMYWLRLDLNSSMLPIKIIKN